MSTSSMRKCEVRTARIATLRSLLIGYDCSDGTLATPMSRTWVRVVVRVVVRVRLAPIWPPR